MRLCRLFNSFREDLGIDLGTVNTLIYARGRGIVIDEPSVIAFNKITHRVEAIGKEAKEMLGRTPRNIVAIEPLKEGVIANPGAVEKMLRHYLSRAHWGNGIFSPGVVIGVPGKANQVERRAVEDAAYRAGASRVLLVEEAMAAAIGTGLKIDEPRANMIVDMGGGTTEVAVLSLSETVYSREVRIAGNSLNESIVEYIKRRYRLLIGSLTAERIKIDIGSACLTEIPLSVEVSGRNLMDGIPKSIVINSKEVHEAMRSPLNTIIHTIRELLARIPPELSGDIIDSGITLTGGTALLRDMDKRLMEDLNLPVKVDKTALESVAIGAGKMLENRR